jgi:hypothetical protein
MFEECVRCVLPGFAGVALRLAIAPLGFASIIAGFFLAARIKQPVLQRTVSLEVIPASVVLFLVIPIVLTSDWPGRYSPLILRAEPFQWPDGCVNRTYEVGDPISINCHEYKNAISRRLVLEHGFESTNTRVEHTYFRVGDDAIQFDCDFGSGTCRVRHIERHVFHRA